MKFCTECGAPKPSDTAKFCGECGETFGLPISRGTDSVASTHETSREEGAPEHAETDAHLEIDASSRRTLREEHPERFRTYMYGLVGLGIIVATAMIAVWVVGTSKSGPDPESSASVSLQDSSAANGAAPDDLWSEQVRQAFEQIFKLDSWPQGSIQCSIPDDPTPMVAYPCDATNGEGVRLQAPMFVDIDTGQRRMLITVGAKTYTWTY